MSKEIKFRCFRGNTMHNNTESLRILYNKSTGYTLTADAIIMQFTGRKDKNNVDVYEGDIVSVRGTKKIGTYNTVIEWQHDGWALRENKTYYIDSRALIAIINVIGNIYENPELLQP